MPFITPKPSIIRSHCWLLVVLGALVSGLCVIEALLPESAHARGALSALPNPKGMIIVDTDGFVISRNPIWNSCTRSDRLLPSFLRSNPDTVTHRQGRIRVERPLSCKDYQVGIKNVWKHPDFLDVEVYLSTKGKLLGVLSSGYVIERKSKE